MAKPRREVVDSNVREWHTKRALESMVSLADIAMELTLDEVIYCLNLESITRRRKSIISTLIRLAAKLKKREYVEQLEKTYHGTPEVAHPR
jgi:hypothetical protein